MVSGTGIDESPGNQEVSALLETRHELNANKKFELGYDNELEHKAQIEGNEFTLNYQRIPIGPDTTRSLGRFVIKSDFFVRNLSLDYFLSSQKATAFRVNHYLILV